MPAGDARIAKIPQLYGATLRDPTDGGASGVDVKPYVECLPAGVAGVDPNTVATDTYAGPRKCDSGDTGSTMTVADYAKFYEMLLAGGMAADGTVVLSPLSVRELCYGRFDGIDRQSKLVTRKQPQAHLTRPRPLLRVGSAVTVSVLRPKLSASPARVLRSTTAGRSRPGPPSCRTAMFGLDTRAITAVSTWRTMPTCSSSPSSWVRPQEAS